MGIFPTKKRPVEKLHQDLPQESLPVLNPRKKHKFIFLSGILLQLSVSKWSTKTEEEKTRPGPFWCLKMHIGEEIIKNSIQFGRRRLSWSPLAKTWITESEELYRFVPAREAQPFGGHCHRYEAPPRLLNHWPSGPHWSEGEKKSTTQKAAGWSHRVSSEKIRNSFVIWTRSFLACFRMI